MPNLRIVYTPDAENFRIDKLVQHTVRYVSETSSQKLRSSYHNLMTEMPDLPSKVGVVTFDIITKRFIRARSPENPSTYYYPLDIFEKIIELEKSGSSLSRIELEYIRRESAALLCNDSILLDERPSVKRISILTPMIPCIQEVASRLHSLTELVEKEGSREVREDFEEAVSIAKEMPSFNQVREFYEYLLKEFEQNKASREFPLFYVPVGLVKPELCTVSLLDRTEVPEYIKNLFKLVDEDESKDFLKKLESEPASRIDNFGETTYVDGLEALLQSLPEPRTIITDTYVVTHFPQLNEYKFSTREFK